MTSLGLTQSQKMAQGMVLAPQMQQSLNILQAATQDLRQMMQQEIAQNPVLEMEAPETALEDLELEQVEDDSFEDEFSRLSTLDDEWREYMSQSRTRAVLSAEEAERRQFLLDSLTLQKSLSEHLQEQLATEGLTPEERADCLRLIGYLDERGFLSQPLSEIVTEEGVSLERLQRAKGILQSLDPAGVGAETLQESLQIQLLRDRRGDSLEYKIVTHHLDELARRKFPELARKLHVSVERVTEAASSIALLNPRPGADFSTENHIRYVQPDLHVEAAGDDYVIVMNDEALPRLRISNHYKDLMAGGSTTQEVRGYIRDRVRHGKFFIQAIEQRQKTIRRIAEEIVARQREFFRYGPTHLKPMSMAQLAEVVGVHETTISRAVSGKYMMTPQGLYEMRYFFTVGIQSESGESISNVRIKTTLAEVIKGEDARKPLSDEKIVKIMSERGIKLARRTVAKYREELGILPSHLRKGF